MYGNLCVQCLCTQQIWYTTVIPPCRRLWQAWRFNSSPVDVCSIFSLTDGCLRGTWSTQAQGSCSSITSVFKVGNYTKFNERRSQLQLSPDATVHPQNRFVWYSCYQWKDSWKQRNILLSKSISLTGKFGWITQPSKSFCCVCCRSHGTCVKCQWVRDHKQAHVRKYTLTYTQIPFPKPFWTVLRVGSKISLWLFFSTPL